MRFFTNDRIIPRGRVLKCLITDSGTGARDLNAAFRLLDGELPVEGAQFRAPAGFRKQEDIPGSPYSFGELPTTGVKPGAYALETLLQSKALARRECLIIEGDAYNKMMDSTARQGLVRQTVPRGRQELADSWLRAWSRLFNYLGSGVRYSLGAPVSLFDIGFDIELRNRSDWKDICLEAADWAHFHVLRFAFNQVFFGGALKVRQTEDSSALVFEIAVSSNTPLVTRLPADLQPVADSLKPDGYSVGLEWMRAPDTYRGTLKVAWRRAG
jgi:hypothetical protein